MLNGLDLFSGIGGISLGLKEWVRPIAYCEKDPYPRAVLLSRMETGELPAAPIWDDVTTLDGCILGGQVDIIYGGFPCQDISCAGLGAGLEGERSGLFFEVCRLVEEIQPRFVFLENVPAIRTQGLREVVRSFTDLRYDCRWTCISAQELGAPHVRKRWFLLAHAQRSNLRAQSGGWHGESWEEAIKPRIDGEEESLAYPDDSRQLQQARRKPQSGDGFRVSGEVVAHSSNGERLEGRGQAIRQSEYSKFTDPGWWESEPNVGRVVNGLPFRVDRIKGLGNAVVPAQVSEAFKRLLSL
jgi:DNA (cytosine-5)-methyltransferase 1